MARLITEIYDEIIVEKQSQAALNGLQPAIDDSQTLLTDLTSTSKVAIWRLWAFLMAVAIWSHEKVLDLHTAEIEERATNLIVGTTRWYQQEALRFQNGDALTWDGVKFVYPVITPANQIIKRAAVQEGANRVTIKVAKLDGNGDPIPLTAGENAAYTAFVEEDKIAGTNIQIISDDADDIKVTFEVKVNAQVINPLDGSLISDPAVFPVIDAINGHIKALDFDGILSLTELVDAVQAAEGVLDPVLIEAQAKFGLFPYTPIVKTLNPNAGHLILDEPSSLITYEL